MDDLEGGLIRPGGKVDPDAVRSASEALGDEDGPVHVRFQLQRDLRKRLDRYLTDRIPFMSRTQLRRLIENEAVTVNGRAPKPSTSLRAGDIVDVVVPPPPSADIGAEEIPIDVLYEDEHIIVLDKRADIIVHPARSHLSGTLINALVWHFRNRSATGGELSSVGEEFARPGVVHRLDRDTTGAIVFAKTDEAHWKLGRQFEQRRVNKRYLALVHGHVQPTADVIDLPLGPSPSREKGHREKQVVRHDELGKSAVTVYRVRELYRDFSLVELELRTGRTHQIRVHLSHLGYPIVGDDMYGGAFVDLAEVAGGSDDACAEAARALARDERRIERQMLHAALLGFHHPISGDPLEFTAPAPVDMRRLVAILRACRPSDGRIETPGATVDLDAAIGGWV